MMNKDSSSAGNKKGKDNSGIVIKLEKGQSPREGANLNVVESIHSNIHYSFTSCYV